MRFLYILAVYLAVPWVSLAMLWRGFRDRAYWERFGERFGFGARMGAPGIWIHAVSVGEVQAAAPLVRALRERHPDLPIVITALTPTGAQRARSLFKDNVQVRFIPFDLPGSVRRFLDRVRPRLAVIFETELWPNLYHERARRGIPLVLASARISARSMSRYSKLGSLFRDILSGGIVVAAQTQADADRFRSLGADPTRTHVTGNIKFDFAVPADLAERGRRLREQYAAAAPIWVAGSTHEGEEEIVLEAHAPLAPAVLVLAPRHPARFDEVAELLQRRGVRFERRSRAAATAAASPAEPASTLEVLLVDTLGELLEFYAAADVAFVGGSLVPIGGHNLLEPAAVGVPILTGPHNSNSEEVAQLLIASGAAAVVHNASELAHKVAALLADPQARAHIGELGRASVHNNRGALEKLLGLIEPLLRG